MAAEPGQHTLLERIKWNSAQRRAKEKHVSYTDLNERLGTFHAGRCCRSLPRVKQQDSVSANESGLGRLLRMCHWWGGVPEVCCCFSMAAVTPMPSMAATVMTSNCVRFP